MLLQPVERRKISALKHKVYLLDEHVEARTTVRFCEHTIDVFITKVNVDSVLSEAHCSTAVS